VYNDVNESSRYSKKKLFGTHEEEKREVQQLEPEQCVHQPKGKGEKKYCI
jgi:hypothetical protein